MKILKIIMLLTLAGCRFAHEVPALDLLTSSNVIPSGSLENQIVGEAVFNRECNNLAYLLVKNPGNYFKLNSRGEIQLAISNPPPGTYELVIQGECDSKTISRNTAITVEAPLIPVISVTSSPSILSSNASNYSLSGICSEEGQPVSIDIEGISPAIQPICSLGIWNVNNLNLSSLADGNILITADHQSITGDHAPQATRNILKDILLPGVSLSTMATSPQLSAPFAVTITFTEPITGFEIGDISVSNGSTSNFSGTGSIYTVDITPNGTGLVTIGVTASVVSDIAGNPNSAAASLGVNYISIIPMVSVWRVGAIGFGDGDNSITLPLRSGFNYNFTANWGDGTSSQITSSGDPDTTHVYTVAGDYTVTLDGVLEAWRFNLAGDKDKIIQVVELGDVGWLSFEDAFRGCENLTTFEGGNLSSVTNIEQMFERTRLVNPNTVNWDTSSIEIMTGAFRDASSADPDVSNWDTSSVTTMNGMWQNTYNGYSPIANPDVSSWNTISLVNISSMFRGTRLANPDISNWNTSNIMIMDQAFDDAEGADPDMGNWDFSSVTNMQYILSTFSSPAFPSSNMSNENYSRFLIQLNATNPTGALNLNNIPHSFQASATAARTNLLLNGWTFNDRGAE